MRREGARVEDLVGVKHQGRLVQERLHLQFFQFIFWDVDR